MLLCKPNVNVFGLHIWFCIILTVVSLCLTLCYLSNIVSSFGFSII